MTRIPRAIAAGLCMAFTAVAAVHAGSDTSDDPVVLTVTVSRPGSETAQVVSLSLNQIRALGETSFTTATPWTESAEEFTGVELAALLDLVDVESGQVTATALNNYFVEIPVSDAAEYGPVVAYERNGELMSVRDKGPLWVVYPYDAGPEYRTEVIYSRSIWQLDRLDIRDN